jgi:hypothetical protein
MTNGEKYKTAKERNRAYVAYCESMRKENLPIKHGRFEWLELEYKVELKPCPFCGSEASINRGNDPIIYQVMIPSEIYAIPSYPYIGKDKEIAIAIATAHIAKGDTTTINEIKASELMAQFDRENKKGNSNDTRTN